VIASADRPESGGQDGWIDEMKVTFDADELASFYDRFLPLEIGEDGIPALPDD
jgi:hypothetical protein